MLVRTPSAHAVLLVEDFEARLAHGHMHGFHLSPSQPEQTGVEALGEIPGGQVIDWPGGADKILYAAGKE